MPDDRQLLEAAINMMRSAIYIVAFALVSNAHAQNLECRFELSASKAFEAGAWKDNTPDTQTLNFKFSEFDHHKQRASKRTLGRHGKCLAASDHCGSNDS